MRTRLLLQRLRRRFKIRKKAAQQHIQRLGLALEDKTSQLDMQTVRIEALTADLERAAQDMRTKLEELSETQSALQVGRHRFWNAARSDDMAPRT